MTGARLRVAITPDDVGSRVSVRVRDDADGRQGFRDVVGQLESWTEGHLQIRRRDGEMVAVSAAALVAGKVVPAPPPRRR